MSPQRKSPYVLKTASAFYLAIDRERVERGFLISNVSTDNICLAYRCPGRN